MEMDDDRLLQAEQALEAALGGAPGAQRALDQWILALPPDALEEPAIAALVARSHTGPWTPADLERHRDATRVARARQVRQRWARAPRDRPAEREALPIADRAAFPVWAVVNTVGVIVLIAGAVAWMWW